MRNPDQSRLMELMRDYADICWQEGMYVGMKSASDIAIQEAGEEFKKGEDVKAKLLRQIGQDIHKNALMAEAKEKIRQIERKNKIYQEILSILESLKESLEVAKERAT